MFTIGRIVYRWEGVFFPAENALSVGKGGWECIARAKYAIYDCLVVYGVQKFNGEGEVLGIWVAAGSCTTLTKSLDLHDYHE